MTSPNLSTITILVLSKCLRKYETNETMHMHINNIYFPILSIFIKHVLQCVIKFKLKLNLEFQIVCIRYLCDVNLLNRKSAIEMSFYNFPVGPIVKELHICKCVLYCTDFHHFN